MVKKKRTFTRRDKMISQTGLKTVPSARPRLNFQLNELQHGSDGIELIDVADA